MIYIIHIPKIKGPKKVDAEIAQLVLDKICQLRGEETIKVRNLLRPSTFSDPEHKYNLWLVENHNQTWKEGLQEIADLYPLTNISKEIEVNIVTRSTRWLYQLTLIGEREKLYEAAIWWTQQIENRWEADNEGSFNNKYPTKHKRTRQFDLNKLKERNRKTLS